MSVWVERYGFEINVLFDELGKIFFIFWKDVIDVFKVVGDFFSIDMKDWMLFGDIKNFN